MITFMTHWSRETSLLIEGPTFFKIAAAIIDHAANIGRIKILGSRNQTFVMVGGKSNYLVVAISSRGRRAADIYEFSKSLSQVIVFME